MADNPWAVFSKGKKGKKPGKAKKDGKKSSGSKSNAWQQYVGGK